ncbi:MAG: hypothetical protein ACLGH4_00675 [Actinomycetes bacterium]
MRTFTVVAVASLAAAGCAPPTSAQVAPVPPVRHVTVSDLPDQPFHDTDEPLDTVSLDRAVDATDPVAVAIRRITDGLRAEGLDVIDVGVQELAQAGGRITVRVAVTHRTGPDTTPYTSIYEVDLVESAGGTWVITAARTVG